MKAGAGITRRILAIFILADLFCASAGANLVSQWKFDETAGTIAYDSAGTNNGTLRNGPVWIPGKLGGALSFDGTDDYVEVGSPTNLNDLPTYNFTISAWIYDRYSSGNTWGTILGTYVSPNGWSFRTFSNATGNRSLYFQVPFSGSNQSAWATYWSSDGTISRDTWHHVAAVWESGTKTAKLYIDGAETTYQTASPGMGAYNSDASNNKEIGRIPHAGGIQYFNGIIDDVRIYGQALSAGEIQQLYTGVIGNNAYNPVPLNGAADVNNTVVLSWTPGPNAVSHDVYFGTGFNDVNNANTASSEYRGNHSLNANSYDPNLLEYGITYYWRIDEINDVNTVKGFVWNFTTKSFSPPDGAEGIDPNVILGWAAGQDAVSYNIYFGINFYDVDNATESSSEYKGNQLINNRSYNLGTLQSGTTYYWRIDKIKADESVTKGSVRNFTTALFPNFGIKAYNPQPPYGTERTGTNVILSWTAGRDAASHNIYFGTNFSNIYNATTASSEYKGNQALNGSSYNPGPLQSGTTYHWRIDELNSDGNTTKGFIWNFTTDGGSIYSCSNGSIHPDYWKFYVPRMILIKTPSDVNHYRTNVINYLWPQTGWPGSKMPQSVTTVHDPDHGIYGNGWYVNLNNISLVAKVDRLDIKMDRDTRGNDYHSYAYLLHPKTSVNRLLIFHQGHDDDLLSYGGKETMEFFLNRGFSIMTFWMPVRGENIPNYWPVNQPYHVDDYHGQLHDLLGDSFIHVFLEPVFVGINYVESQYDFRDIAMIGISGGGWTTHLCAALDPRIKLSFPTAGSFPMFLRNPNGPCPNMSWGDAEQNWPELYGFGWLDGYASVTGWLDLYIMGSYGEYRQQVHILNQNDSCCFWGVNYRTYEPYLRDAVKQLGQGAYSVYLDTTHSEHKISNNAITNVIYPKLQENFIGRQADFTEDGRIDIDDLTVFADAWLSQPGAANWNEKCDLSHDGQITMLDLAEFAKYWLWQAD